MPSNSSTKSDRLALRIDPELKVQATRVAKHLGIPLSLLVTRFLRQIVDAEKVDTEVEQI